MRTRIRHRVLLALSLFCAMAPLSAVDTSKFKPTGYVNDFAGAFDQQNKLQAESLLRRLDRAAGVQISLVTILTLEGEPIEDVANRLYREWGIGKKDTNEGALVLLAVNDRKYRVEVGYGLEPILPDGYVGGVLRDVGPALKQGHYGAALLTVTQNFAQRVAEKKNVSLEGLPERRKPARSRGGGLPIGLIVLAVIVLFALFSGGSRGGGGLGTMSDGDMAAAR